MVKARIKEASKYVPLENLYLSPQCGFASCEIGNKLTEEEQWAKIALIQEIARRGMGRVTLRAMLRECAIANDFMVWAS